MWFHKVGYAVIQGNLPVYNYLHWHPVPREIIVSLHLNLTSDVEFLQDDLNGELNLPASRSVASFWTMSPCSAVGRGWEGSKDSNTPPIVCFSSCSVAATRPRQHAGTTPRWPSSTSLWVSSPVPLVVNLNRPPPHCAKSPLTFFFHSTQQPTWTTCGSRPTGRPWSSGACRRPSAVSIQWMYLCPSVCIVPVYIFRSPSACGALSTSAPLPCYLALPLFFSFVLPAPVVGLFSNSPLFFFFFAFYSSPSSSDTSSSCVVCALFTYTVRVGGSCLLSPSRFLAAWIGCSVSCPRAVTCALRC